MAAAVGLSEGTYLVLGTAAMLLMVTAVIAFALAFQRKLAHKAREYRAIEKLMKEQELQSAYFVIEGQEQERKRIASELHDNIGGLLATLKIYSDLSVSSQATEDISRLNRKMNGLSATLADEVRKLSHELDLRTLSGFGLKVAVQHLCEALNDSGKIAVTAVIDMLKPVQESRSFHLYRIIQELVTNTLKHAEATHIRIELTQIEDELTLIYEDNGHGFDATAETKGMGMQNIRARLNQIGGKLTMDASEKGTTCIIELENDG
jgi:hypothetical protein